jgi:signal transduction histidine kinase
VVLVIAPLAVLAVGVRREMSRRLAEQYERRVETLATVIEDDLERRSVALGERLAALAAEIAADNRFRLAAVIGQADQRPYLLDYAPREMRLLGLSMLQIQDEDGRILSSGHFRNEFDRMDPDLPRLLASVATASPIESARARPQRVTGCAIVRARRPEGSFLALARVDSARVGARRFSLVGGFEIDSTFLAGLSRDPDLAVTLDTGESDAAASPAPAAGSSRDVSDEAIVRSIGIAYVERDASEPAGRRDARLVVSHSLAPLHDLLRRLDRWLALLLAGTAAGTLALALWLSARISGPLDALARKAARIDLDHLDVDFASRRADEVGVLSRFLAEMTARLRRSAESQRDAERRATLGDMARQVNHDVRNAMTPIRNVVRHLGQVARETPDRLGGVFLEREATIDSSLAYLEALAANYARLSPRIAREPLDANAIVREVAGAAGGDAAVRLELADGLPVVLADQVGLRRVVENLVRNARESLVDGAGVVTVTTESAAAADGARVVRVRVLDTGRGMSREERERIFDHFYTTKADGTGLGLSIVRRLVSDFEGTVEVESAPGRGTTVTVTLPAREARP